MIYKPLITSLITTYKPFTKGTLLQSAARFSTDLHLKKKAQMFFVFFYIASTATITHIYPSIPPLLCCLFSNSNSSFVSFDFAPYPPCFPDQLEVSMGNH